MRTVCGVRGLLSVCGALALAGGRPAAATTYSVAPMGKDTNLGTSASPWKTLQKAADVMVAGDTVLIADGDYAGGITQSTSGTAAAPITFQAVHPGMAIVHGDQTINRDAFFVTFADHVILDGLTIQKANRAGIRIDNSNFVTVRRGRFLNNHTWGIFTDYSDDLLLEYNECAGSVVEHGIYASNSGDRPIIRFNVAHDNHASGIQINADPAQQDPSLGTRGDGITENAIVESNIAYNNGAGGGAAINLASVRTSRIVNNLLYNNLAGGIAGWDDGDGIQWGSKNNTILHNTIVFQAGQGRWCISLKNGSTGNLIQNNVLRGGARGAIEIDNDSSVISDYNLLWPVGNWGVATNEDTGVFYSLAAWKATGNDTHSVGTDPKFANAIAAPYDFRLLSGSPALDSGVDRPDVPFDLDGRARPFNSKWDMGCYERPGAAITLSGAITLQDCVHGAQPLTFTFRPTDNSLPFTRAVTLASDGSFSLDSIPPNTYSLAIKGAKWLQQAVAVNAMNGNIPNLAATLPAGDANDDNTVDFDDLTILAIAYNTATGDPLFDDRADFNCDGQVEFADLTLLAINYNTSGDP